MAHTLVIGGTGMLHEATLWLIRRANTVSVVARNRSRIEEITEEMSQEQGVVNALAVDYTDQDALHDSILKAQNDYGSIDLVVSWIHSSAPLAHATIAELINNERGFVDQACQWFDLLGSAVADPASTKKDCADDFARWKGIDYHRVILGFVVESGSSRWLSNAEISAGVIKAVHEGSETSVVGQVDPWSLRP